MPGGSPTGSRHAVQPTPPCGVGSGCAWHRRTRSTPSSSAPAGSAGSRSSTAPACFPSARSIQRFTDRRMYLHALATAVPSARYTQAECLDIAQRSKLRERLKKRSMLILQTILKGEHGIATRHFAVPGIEGVFDFTPDQLNHAFRAAAPELAGRALTTALERAGVRADRIDALLICTCTGYLCPGVTSYVA